MKRKVEITAPAEAEMEELYLWIREDSPERAAAWRQGLYKAAERLSTFPERFAVAAENDLVSEEIRQFFYKPCRMLYTVTEHTVYVLHIRGPGQNLLSSPDVRLPE